MIHQLWAAPAVHQGWPEMGSPGSLVCFERAEWFFGWACSLTQKVVGRVSQKDLKTGV